MAQIIYGCKYKVSGLTAFWPNAWKYLAAGAVVVIEENENYQITLTGTFAGNNARTFLHRGNVAIRFQGEPTRDRFRGITTRTTLDTLQKHIAGLRAAAQG